MSNCNCPSGRAPMILHMRGCPMRQASPMFIDSARLAQMRKELEEDSSCDSRISNDLDELLTLLGYPAPAWCELCGKKLPNHGPLCPRIVIDDVIARRGPFALDPDGDPLV
jgi:hypothetical protein